MFKKIKVELTGFKSEIYYLRELSIRQLGEVMKADGDDIKLLLTAVKYSLVDGDNVRVCNDKYTIDDLADELPQSYLTILADAWAALNDDSELDHAKKS